MFNVIHQTDGRTDGQTSYDGNAALCMERQSRPTSARWWEYDYIDYYASANM